MSTNRNIVDFASEAYFLFHLQVIPVFHYVIYNDISMSFTDSMVDNFIYKEYDYFVK